MALNETVANLKDLMNQITSDLEKAEKGNKTAAQRVRTGTILLQKLSKTYRRESIDQEKV